MTDLDIQELANLTAGDADVDNFERLFTKLKEMKGNEEKQNDTTLTVNTNSHGLSFKNYTIFVCSNSSYWGQTCAELR